MPSAKHLSELLRSIEWNETPLFRSKTPISMQNPSRASLSDLIAIRKFPGPQRRIYQALRGLD